MILRLNLVLRIVFYERKNIICYEINFKTHEQ